MYKFKASKYKNAQTTNAKKEECVTDITVETPVTNGNNSAASAKLVAFCVGSANGGRIMVLDINTRGRLGSAPVLNAHSDAVTDLAFSPFNHCRLATAGADNTVKIWDLPAEGITDSFNDAPVQRFSDFSSRPECVAFHPVAEDILAVASGSMLYICNVEDGSNVLELDTGRDLIQSISWKKDGTLIAVTTKDLHLLICDPRAGKILSLTQAHENHKESRVIWLGETNKVLTTGFTKDRSREIKIWDVSGDKPICLQSENFGAGTGVMMPFYDEDTGMLFVSGKGDSNIAFLEIFDDKNPPMKHVTQQLLQNQTKGMCIVPKLGVNAPECEVNLVFQLAQKMLVPISWKVPRKTLREFPLDLFPETASDEPAMTAQDWINGENNLRKKTSLEPNKRNPLRLTTTVAGASSVKQTNGSTANVKETVTTENQEPQEPTVVVSSKPQKEEKPVLTQPKYKPFTGVRKSIFRHWKCTIGHPSNHVTNVGPISLTVSTTSDHLRCSELYAAVPLKGPGGQIAIIDFSKPGRMTNENSLVIQNSKGVTDLQWNPFNQSQIAVALESSSVKIWNIPKNKFGEILENQTLFFNGHASKPVALCFHPLAENIIASGDVESRILIWDANTGDTYFELSCGDSEVMSIAWSLNGQQLAVSSKDKMLRIYDPRKSTEPIQIGLGPAGARSSRIKWACDDKFIAISGFDKASSRTVSLYSTSDIASGPVSEECFSNSPSVLMMHYDEDSSTLLFTSKGDSPLQALEISETEPPHLFRIASFTSDSVIQGISFISKKTIKPKNVEFAKAWCLTKSTLQPMSITVPRVKMEYFQDDIFPPTSVTWEKTLTASEWMKGTNKIPRKLNLKPQGMIALSQAPPEEAKPKKYQSYDATTYKTDEEKKEELLVAMSGKLDLDKELEQDTMDGVDEDEWDDY